MFKMNLAGHSECAELLLEHGALVDELDVKARVFFQKDGLYPKNFICVIFFNLSLHTHGESNNRLLS